MKKWAYLIIGLLAGALLLPSGILWATDLLVEKSSHVFYVDGEATELTAWNINGNNFVRLRDVGEALDFAVGYEPLTGAVVVDSAAPYDEKAAVSSSLTGEYADSTQLLLVTVPDRKDNIAAISAYQKTALGWEQQMTTTGKVGRAGIVPKEERQQDTGTTPAGIMRLTAALGIADDPGSRFPYTPITAGMYWDLNSGSSTYNRLLYRDPGGDREDLLSVGRPYDYVLTTDYNQEQTDQKGGAIFVHVASDKPTSGCISMPEADMRWLVTWADPAQSPVMLVTTTTDVPKYFDLALAAAADATSPVPPADAAHKLSVGAQALVNVPVGKLMLAPEATDDPYDLADEALYGMTVTVREVAAEGWVKVETHYRYEGYIKASQLIVPPAGIAAWEEERSFVTALSAPLYREASAAAEVVLELPKSAVVKVVSADPINGFSQLLLADGSSAYIKSDALGPYHQEPSAADEAKLRQNLVDTALTYLGCPYLWGGKTPWGIDCSGLTSTVYMLNGVIIYRDAEIKAGFPVHEIAREQMKPGDLIFFPGHVAMYLGDERYIHATGKNGGSIVRIYSLDPADPEYNEEMGGKITQIGSIF